MLVRQEPKIQVVPPVVGIYPSAFMIMMKMADLSAPNETSGLAYVEKKHGMPVITRVIFRGGHHTGGGTQITSVMLDYINELVEDNRTQENQLIHCWWHSHVDFTAFWSERDQMTMRGDEGRVCSGWMISIVLNRRQEYRCSLTLYEPVKIHFDNVPLLIYGEEDPISGREAVRIAKAIWDDPKVGDKLYRDRLAGIPAEPEVVPPTIAAMEQVAKEAAKEVEVVPNFWERHPVLRKILESIGIWWVRQGKSDYEDKPEPVVQPSAPPSGTGLAQPAKTEPETKDDGTKRTIYIGPPKSLVKEVEKPKETPTEATPAEATPTVVTPTGETEGKPGNG